MIQQWLTSEKLTSASDKVIVVVSGRCALYIVNSYNYKQIRYNEYTKTKWSKTSSFIAIIENIYFWERVQSTDLLSNAQYDEQITQLKTDTD